MIEFFRDTCANLHLASQKEWLVTNGIGGFSAGTISGVLTRRYHGLLIAALQPPLGRTLLITKFEETAFYAGKRYPLSVDRWADGAFRPQGNLALERFYLDRTIPVWEYALADALIEKRIWMVHGENTTCVRYSILRPGVAPIRLSIQAIANARDYHGMTHLNQVSPDDFRIDHLENGLQIHAGHISQDFYILSTEAQFERQLSWQPGYYLAAEAARGESSIEDHLNVGTITVALNPDQPTTFVLSTQRRALETVGASFYSYQSHETEILGRANLLLQGPLPGKAAIEQLVLAAEQFVVSRPSKRDPDGKTILAGYPWFSDWGRDTMISLPGLTLTTGRTEVARSILTTFADFIDQGMLPNRFPDQGDTPEYNTVDAALWYVESVRAYFDHTNDLDLLSKLYPFLQEIIHWYQVGTRYKIHCDPQDGLIYSGELESQLTWMDVRIDGWAVTPRIGKAVEINALWYNALCAMIGFAERLGHVPDSYTQLSEITRQGFQRFWNADKGFYFDVLDGPTGNDPTLRPNQLLAISLHYSPSAPEHRKPIIERCALELLTSYGLRSLAAGETGYIGTYCGDRWQRDSAYHQGTVWAWLIGPFISAHLKVFADPQLAWSFLRPLISQLWDHGLGSISEIFDGDPPHKPEGCPAQAWSVAEVLRAIQEIQKIMANGPN